MSQVVCINLYCLVFINGFVTGLTIVDGPALVAVDPVEADAAPLGVPLPGDAHLVLVPHRELHRQRLRAQEPAMRLGLGLAV